VSNGSWIADGAEGIRPLAISRRLANRVPGMKEQESQGDLAERARRQRLGELREALLELHKALVESERVSYEATVGRIHSPNHFLKLLTGDPWFAWLQPLSQFIVALDMALEEPEPLTAGDAEALIEQAGLLLVASEDGEGFPGHYYAALQRDPDVVLAQAGVSRLIRRRGARS
jgi:hypothetical protein